MPIKLTILGSSAALPAYNRNLSAHLLELDGQSLLFDCGEGTQFQLRKFKKSFQKINSIFISHTHGDHFFGLPGLISSMQMLGRNRTLNIYGPRGIEEAISAIMFQSRGSIIFDIKYHIISTNTKIEIANNKKYKVFAFPLKHSVETYGYLFLRNKEELNIKKDFLANNEVSIEQIKQIKTGSNFIDKNGTLFANKDITKEPKDRISYAYCSDTAYFKELAVWVKDVKLLYHESTYISDNKSKAKERLHSTANDAAKIALKANAKILLLGHFSGRYKNLDLFKKEAEIVFNNVKIGIEGMELDL